jgi:hypothetical protein
MRIHIAHLRGAGVGEFVGARFTLPQDPILDASGLGEFVSANYTLPQNPILDAMSGGTGLSEFVFANFTLPQNPILDAGVGDMVDTAPMYPIPINSVMQEVESGGLGDCGCGCGGDGGCGGGLGALTDDISSFFSTQWANIQAGDMTTIALWGGGALVLALLLFSGGKGRSAYATGKRELRSEYKKKLAKLRAESPTTAARIARAGRAAAGAF